MNTFGNITVQDCINTVPPPDTRCSDPTFAALNPSICAATPALVIKPGSALTCALGSIQFSAVLATNGVEQDVSDQCTWQSSNLNTAIIGATSGNATGLASGDATISATYQTYTATASLNVMGTAGDCCGAMVVGMMLVVDKSLSMAQAFGSSYNTRLDFARAAAERFSGEVNGLKDTVGLISFDDTQASLVDSLTGDTGTVETDVGSVQQGQAKTSFYDALQEAITTLNSAGPDLKVIVLFSDGEDTGTDAADDYIDGNNPVTLLQGFKDSGGVVICLGCRASGGGFALLSAFSTGGFFINGVPGSEGAALDYLSGLKGYICAGNCTPSGDVITAEGALAYSSFKLWNVQYGTVDLLGNGFLDVLPGNGLYVDLRDGTGRLVTKTAVALTPGDQYRFSAKVAGNQIQPGSPYSVTFQVFSKVGGGEVPLMSQTVLVSDYTQPFTTVAFTFTAPATAGDAYISIQGGSVPAGNNQNLGLLVSMVKFDDATTYSNLFYDNFSTENQVFVPPACGPSSLYTGVYGYNCYGSGCLDTPPPAQLPDPAPLPNIEGGNYVPPGVSSSTQTACAQCAMNSINQDPADVLGISASLGLTLSASAIAACYYWSGTLSSGDYTAYGTTSFQIDLQGSNDGGSTWATINTQYGALIVALFNTVNQAGWKALFSDNTASYSKYQLVTTPALPASFVTTQFKLLKASQQSICESATANGSSPGDAQNNATQAALALAQAALHCVPAWTATESVTLTCPDGTSNGGIPIVHSATAMSLMSPDDAVAQAQAIATLAAQADVDANCVVGGGLGTFFNIDLPFAAHGQCTYDPPSIPNPGGGGVPVDSPPVTVYVTIHVMANQFSSNISVDDANNSAMTAAQGDPLTAWLAYYCQYPWQGEFTVMYGIMPP